MPGKKSFFEPHQAPLIFAHRGASAIAPENTLAAFKMAIDHQADGIELDAQLTADNQVVVMHDDTVDRTTNGTGRVKSMSLSELRALDAGTKHSPSYSEALVPSLAEVFETVGRDLLINVELKNYTSPIDDLPDKVAALVKEYGLIESVLLSSFNMLALIKARRVLPDIHLGLLTFSGLGEATLRFKLIRFSPLLALHPYVDDVTPQLVRIAHKAKSCVNVYTVKQADVMRNMIAAGVDGIITPDPLMARAVLAEFA